MGPPTGRQARVIHSKERRTGSNDRKTQDSWRGEIKNRKNGAGGDQATKKNSRRTEDWRRQSRNESRPGKEDQRRRKKRRETGG